eukprot:6313836-Lingulodinium_polyedra.AAC.1
MATPSGVRASASLRASVSGRCLSARGTCEARARTRATSWHTTVAAGESITMLAARRARGERPLQEVSSDL